VDSAAVGTAGSATLGNPTHARGAAVSVAGPAHPVRPQLNPALRRIWRDRQTLQLGVDPARAVVIGDLEPTTARLVDRLDGSHDLPGLHAVATRMGLHTHAVDDLLGVLTRAGVLEDAAADLRPLGALSRAERDRLAPDLAAASIARTGSGVAVLGRRQARVVSVHGAGRVGSSLVTLLAAAGVGAVTVEDAGAAGPGDLAPGGLGPDDVGARRQDAAVRAARRLAPSLRASVPAGRRGPDLAVLTGDPCGHDGRLLDRLLRAGVPHLFAGVRDATGLVGPLVLPGRSSCQRCHDLHRTDRDPGWPAVAAALRAGPRGGRSAACDVVLATAVAAQAGLQVLAFLDGDPAPPAVDGTLEIAQEDGQVRRRSWRPHPSCGCTWAHPAHDRDRP
jgi:hypothetical protein